DWIVRIATAQTALVWLAAKREVAGGIGFESAGRHLHESAGAWQGPRHREAAGLHSRCGGASDEELEVGRDVRYVGRPAVRPRVGAHRQLTRQSGAGIPGPGGG